ncbi:NAD-glutamate dehydrogenase [Cohaesibacter intestini]|uniref:NAD-glutamate dehydrogenase n=1 Tax=Cohaesibacter intestini TaxID=2211145 RepID=UPI000DEAEF74|nr:NAD-glutamate dehydrogenase [Cohaesibacter intestini]
MAPELVREHAERLANAKAIAAKQGDLEADFLERLLKASDKEDLSRYRAEEIAHFAQQAFERFTPPFDGGHTIDIFDPVYEGENGEMLNQVSIIQLHNVNKPFLVDSIMGELQQLGFDIHLVLHPIFDTERDDEKKLVGLRDRREAKNGVKPQRESLIHVHVSRISGKTQKNELKKELNIVLEDVSACVTDWKSMLLRLEETIAIFKITPPPLPQDEIEETVEFLRWLVDNNFTLLGMREYAFEGSPSEGELKRTQRPGLGILRNPDVRVLRRGSELVTMTPEIREFLMRPEPLIITKANVKTKVHRRTYMDYIGVKIYGDQGQLTGELRIVGLFTSTAYNRSATNIPFLRRKVARTIDKASVDPSGHSGKALLNVLEGYPRDELFQVDEQTLLNNSEEILRLSRRPRVRVLSRVDKFDRFVSSLVYVPRDRFNTSVRLKIGDYLCKVYDGHISATYLDFPDSPLTRVHFIIGRRHGKTPTPSRLELENEVNKIVTTWADRLDLALRDAMSIKKASQMVHRYCEAFSEAYRDTFSPDIALNDISIMERMNGSVDTAIQFYRDEKEADHRITLKIFHQDNPIPLSERVPILENMGFRVIDERSYAISPMGSNRTFWMHDMDLERASCKSINIKEVGDKLEACFLAIWDGQAENDGYNRLAMAANLHWRDITILRTISRYLRQVRIPYDQDYMWDTLDKYPDLGALLVDLFHARFDPKHKAREEECKRLSSGILTALEQVSNLDDDRILRKFLGVIQASLRTNFYQRTEEGGYKPTLSIKLNPRAMEDMPEPKPFREIFVYSPRVEGLHLRFGKVARGGLRWSDRPQDFRTEVLGLVKAQQVKNAVIVPVGSKGGFVPKHLPPSSDREAFMAEGIASYRLFISSLLDVTDNLEGQTILPPENVTRHDEDDPYLVVAADKGTATFSDIANGISEDHSFWLGDAFASGGSAGYDHKKMGITARGAWEAVKRHFREMDRDIQTEPFTVVGVGDMSGDVFGNGMLLSKATRLIAAFDHRDIFIDPNPDPETSWKERKRIFDLGRSSWKDYDTSLISKGGGVFSRSEKSITLSSEAQQALGLSKKKVTPQELMKAILMAEADLLWFGGIGTYIRASSESDADADDRANDAIRVTPKELRVKAIGEGANLGVTQRARIEFNRLGGRCNTDAIDNSAGVNSSDMEVNIKIALGAAVRKGKMDVTARNKLLSEMTNTVAGLCLRNNYLQTLSVSLTEQRGMEDFGYQRRLMERMEEAGDLDRDVEFLPDNEILNEMRKKGQPLTRAEISVLLAYAKNTLYEDLLESNLPDEDYLERELRFYFPEKMQGDFADEIADHRLRREIITTLITNSMINRGGATLIPRIADKTGTSVVEIARAYVVVRDSFGLRELHDAIDALDSKVSGAMQLELYHEVQKLLLAEILWFMRSIPTSTSIADAVEHYRNGIDDLSPKIDKYLPPYLSDRLASETERYVENGVPKQLASRIAHLSLVSHIPDIILVADKADKSLDTAAEAYFAVAGHFKIGRIDALAQSLDVSDYYEGLALDRVRDSLSNAHNLMTAGILSYGGDNKSGMEQWIEEEGHAIKRTVKAVNAIMDSDTLTVSKFAVAAGLLSDLARDI